VTATFPSAEWLGALCDKLNSDGRYRQIARNWEGDLVFDIIPGGNLPSPVTMYLDLWHGQCRLVEYDPAPGSHPAARFTLRSQYANFASIVLGRMDPMTAMLTSKLKVDGSLGYMMRNVPTVLDFVRCAREITTDVL
jgi:putative sterol carrier protein